MTGPASDSLLRGTLDYLVNCTWQAPLVALAAVALTKAVGASLRGRCLAFAGALMLVCVAPLVPVHPLEGAAMAVAAGALVPAVSTPAAPAPISALDASGLVLAAGLATAFAVVRLAVGWVAARGLVRRATPVRLPPAALRAMQDFLARSGRAPPPVRTCTGLAGPAVVGAWRPVVLVPPGFEGLPEEQLVAALLHECAHVARRDYALNLLCEALALPSSWHPATGALKRRFRAAREAACDQLAAAALGSPARYARCLVELARTVEGGGRRRRSGPALQLVGRGDLEDRVRKLTGPDQGAVRRRPLQTVAGVALALGCLAPLACLHVTPVVRDRAAAREIARVAVFDRETSTQAQPQRVARLTAPPPIRPWKTTGRRLVLADVHVRAATVRLAMAASPAEPFAPAAAPLAVAAPPAVSPPVLALARLYEVPDIGRIVFAVEIGALSPCLVPPPPTGQTRAEPDPAASVSDLSGADFDPFAPALPAPRTVPSGPLNAAVPPRPAVPAPTCLKAASLGPVRTHGLA